MSLVLVGGVAQLYQGDLDAGRLAVERLGAEHLGPNVLVEELSYGAVAVMQRLEDLRPATLVLVGAAERGRPPASVERRRVHDPGSTPDEVQTAVWGAVTGYVSIDLLVAVAAGFAALPPRTVAVEIEPVSCEPATRLTAQTEEALGRALGLVRAEVRRAPVLGLADELRELVADDLSPSRTMRTLHRLLDELEKVDLRGEWGHTFTLRDRLRDQVAAEGGPGSMGALDWALWCALIEELDRLQPPMKRIASDVSSNGGSSSSPRL